MKKNVVLFISTAVACMFQNIQAQPSDSLISQKLNQVVQPSQFSQGHEIFLSSEEIIKQVTPILRKRLVEANYDRIFPVTQFLEHYQKCKKKDQTITPIEACKSFVFHPLIPSFRGGPCVSLTYDLYEHLPEEIKGFIVAARLPGKYQQFAFPQFSHTAILIKYQNPNDHEDNGYILLDPSFDISEPILLKNGGTPFFYDMKNKGVWKFSLIEDQILCEILSEESALTRDESPDLWRMVYLTAKLDNPIESSAVPMIFVDRRLSLLSRDSQGKMIVHLNVELNKKRIVWDTPAGWFEPILFASITPNSLLFPDWFAASLQTTTHELSDRIHKIIQDKKILDSLYCDYLLLLKETQDDSITGKIDRNQIDVIINSIKEL